MKKQADSKDVTAYAEMLGALGTEPRLQIMRLLLSAHPIGMVVGDIAGEFGMPGSSLSHHLEKLKNAGLVSVKRESTFLRYSANTETLRALLRFLFAECCTGRQAVSPETIAQVMAPGRQPETGDLGNGAAPGSSTNARTGRTRANTNN
jgi:DNA-binding transcriptional ArsR family regulator